MEVRGTKQMNKRIIAFVLSVTLIFSGSLGVTASKMSDAQKKRNDAQKNLDKINSSITKMEQERKRVQSQLNAFNEELVQTLLELEILAADIESKKQEIAEAEAEYERLKALEEAQYEAMKKRIQTVYEAGDTDYIAVLLESESIAELLNRAYFAKEISEYDDAKLTEYQETKELVAAQKEELEEDKAELEEIEENEKEHKRSLDAQIAKARKTMANADAELAKARKQADNYRKTIKEQKDLIKKYERQANSAGQGSSSGGSSGNSSGGSSGGGSSSGGGATVSGSGGGSSIASYALQFVGNPYVFGGTSLTGGTDCSGFTMAVHRHFGISIPRTSGSQAGGGRAVSLSDLQAGDIVCYPGHVGIYIGGGKIVHASSERTGIKVSNFMYRTPICARRYW